MTLRRVLDSVSPGLGKRIVYRSGAYVLDAAELWLDISAFDVAMERGLEREKAGDESAAGQAYDAAIELYAGELLPGELYEEWTAGRRQRLQDGVLDILQRRAALGRMYGDFEMSIRLNKRALEIDPALEASHRRLILDYLETGQRSRAGQQVEACRNALRRYLGEEPDSESQAVFARVASPR
jgi:DNA-binding SARP family transcriptional activator